MRHVRLGGTGLRVSQLCLGTMTFGLQCDEPTSVAILDRAAAGGITFLDTSDVYPIGGNLSTVGRTEEILGRWLAGRRQDFVVATKCFGAMSARPWDQGLSRKHILDAIDGSLWRLATDYVDVYQLHHPDSSTPIEESLRALDDLVRQGKVRYIGNSNFPAWRVAEAEYVARAMNVSRFISCQDEYSLVVRDIEKDLLPAAQEYKLGLLPFFPLASGLLTGKYRKGEAAPDDTRFGKVPRLRDRYVTPRNEDIVGQLTDFAKARGHSMLELAFSWLAARPQVSSVIAGATRVEQIEENVKAIAWKLGAEELAEIDRITKV